MPGGDGGYFLMECLDLRVTGGDVRRHVGPVGEALENRRIGRLRRAQEPVKRLPRGRTNAFAVHAGLRRDLETGRTEAERGELSLQRIEFGRDLRDRLGPAVVEVPVVQRL